MATHNETVEQTEPDQRRTGRKGGEHDSPSSESAASPPTPRQNPAPQVRLDESHLVACYANFCRVTGTPEELIIDFGLNPQPFGAQIESLPISQRLIVNFFTAKRMLAALQMAVARHEQAFGVLETDVQKRVLPSALRSMERVR